MARKTFISYKYSEAQGLRDRIIDALGDDATYYMGETSDSPDLTDLKTETIKQKLRDMIYPTSVTILIVSPNMKLSDWIDWEIRYSLRLTTRADRTSQRNGIVGVVMSVGGYDWLLPKQTNPDGHVTTSTNDSYLHEIVRRNRFNQTPTVYACERCRSVSALAGHYISLIKEDEFLAEAGMYIEGAWGKSQSSSGYSIVVDP